MDTQQEQIKEEWRPVVGYEGIYEVSNTGKVNALNYHREKIKKPLKISDEKGYKFVFLYKNGSPQRAQIHRLVAMAFIQNPNNFPVINHKDENPSNNNVENLEWCTQQYNLNYGTRVRRASLKNSKKVLQFTRDGEFIAQYSSFKDAQEKTGLQYTNISKVCRGLREFCGGYRWKYIDDETANRSKRKNDEEKKRILKTKKITTIYQVPVIQYTKKGEMVKEYRTIYDAHKETGIAKRVIYDNCRGVNKSTRKFIFKYKENYE